MKISLIGVLPMSSKCGLCVFGMFIINDLVLGLFNDIVPSTALVHSVAVMVWSDR